MCHGCFTGVSANHMQAVSWEVRGGHWATIWVQMIASCPAGAGNWTGSSRRHLVLLAIGHLSSPVKIIIFLMSWDNSVHFQTFNSHKVDDFVVCVGRIQVRSSLQSTFDFSFLLCSRIIFFFLDKIKPDHFPHIFFPRVWIVVTGSLCCVNITHRNGSENFFPYQRWGNIPVKTVKHEGTAIAFFFFFWRTPSGDVKVLPGCSLLSLRSC